MSGFNLIAIFGCTLMALFVSAFAENDAGVVDDKPEFTTSVQELTEKAGMEVTFECALSKPMAGQSIVWRKGEALLSFGASKYSQNNRLNIVERQGNLGFDLELKNIDVDDEGVYTCEVNTSPKMLQNNKLTVIIPAKIEMAQDKLDHTVHLGERLAVTCEVTGRPTPDVTWTQLGVERKFTGADLVLEKIEKTDAGEYECAASNMAGKTETEVISVSVQYKPDVEVPNPVIYTGSGIDAVLTCNFSASPAAVITWSKDGQSIEDKPNVKFSRKSDDIFDISIVTIVGVTKEDLGTYICTGKNDFGEAKNSVELKGIPKKVEVTSGKPMYSNTYTLTWKTVSNDNIDDYLLQFRKLNGTDPLPWVNITIPGNDETKVHHQGTHVFKDEAIEPRSTYEVIVSAQNSFGWGLPSDLFTFETPQAGITPPPVTSPTPKSSAAGKPDVQSISGNTDSAGSIVASAAFTMVTVAMAALLSKAQ